MGGDILGPKLSHALQLQGRTFTTLGMSSLVSAHVPMGENVGADRTEGCRDAMQPESGWNACCWRAGGETSVYICGIAESMAEMDGT